MSRAELLRRRADLLREVAAVDEELATAEERAERVSAPVGWISQRTSPLGKSKHLVLWRRLRDERAEGIKASGKLRLIRVDVFELALASAEDTPRRRRNVAAPVIDLAEAFGVER